MSWRSSLRQFPHTAKPLVAVVFLTRVKEFSAGNSSSVTASHQELLNESGSSNSSRGWWDFCFTFVVVWLVIIQVVIVLVLIFDDTITAEQGDNVNNFFVIVIGLLFLLIGAGILYQGVRVIFLVNSLLEKYRDWNERTSAAVVQLSQDDNVDSGQDEGNGSPTPQHAGAASTGAGSHAAILALPLVGAPKSTSSARATRQDDLRSTLSVGSGRQAGRGRPSSTPQVIGERQNHNTAPQYFSYGLAADAARASTLYGAVGGAGSVTGDSVSSHPPPALDGVLKRLRLRTYGLTIILPLCFLLRGFLNVVQPTTASGAIDEQGTILFPWFSTVIPDILGSLAVLILTAPYACTYRVGDGEDGSLCWCLLGAVQGGAMAIFDLLKEDCSACCRCMCCCCPSLFFTLSEGCSSGCRSCSELCCGAAPVSRQAVKDWDAVDSMMADGVPQRYFELHSGCQRVLREMDMDVGHESHGSMHDLSSGSTTAGASAPGGLLRPHIEWQTDDIETAIFRHKAALQGSRGSSRSMRAPGHAKLAEGSTSHEFSQTASNHKAWHTGSTETDLQADTIKWGDEHGPASSMGSTSSLSSSGSSVEL